MLLRPSDQEQMAGHRVGAHELMRAQRLRASVGLSVKYLAAEPQGLALGAQVMATTNAPDPVPPQAVERFEPGRLETRVGNYDGLYACWQQDLKPSKEGAMHACIVEMTQWMDLLIERERTSADGQRSPQQLPAAIGCQVGPIHNDQWFAPRAYRSMRECPIQLKAFGQKVPVAQQTIHALDAVLDVCPANKCAPQFGQRQASATHGSPHCRNDYGQPRRMNVRTTRSNQLLYDAKCMHGAVSFEGCEPRKRR